MNNAIYSAAIGLVLCTATYFYAHNSGYEKGYAEEQAVLNKYKLDQDEAVKSYQTQIAAAAAALDAVNIQNQKLIAQQDGQNRENLANETKKPLYGKCIVPAAGVRIYNQRIQATQPSNAN